MSNKVAIFDIDNCIADDTHRLPLIDYNQRDPVARYEAYHRESHKDEPKNVVVVRFWFSKADRVAFLTSRPIKFRQMTQEWLAKHIIPNDSSAKWSLFMRDNDDLRSSPEVKQAQLERLAGYGCQIPDDILVAFDDRKDILRMYEQNGINAIQMAIRPEVEQEERALGAPGGPLVPAQILRAAAKTFEQRNAIYGSNYKAFGEALLGLFPDRTIPEIKTADDANRLNLMMDCLCKLQRYGYGFKRGGHKDSARDLIVYAAMLEENTIE